MFFEFHNLTIQGRGELMSLPFLNMKEAVLGKEYNVSLNFVTSDKMQELNFKYRKIDKPTDILSFEISRDAGEIFICITEAKKKLEAFNMNLENFIGLLFIHGLLHLKGLDHGKKMEKEEEKYKSYFQIKTI